MMNPEALRAAHGELVAAYQDFSRALASVRSTFIYEELLPVAEELDEVLQRFLTAAQPFVSAASSSTVEPWIAAS